MPENEAWEQVNEQCPDLRSVDLLIGIPTFNHGSTVENVIKSIKAGLEKTCPDASVLLVNADAGSQDNTPALVNSAVGGQVPCASIRHVTGMLSTSPFSLDRLSDSGVPEREEAFRSFFFLSGKLEAKACVVIDGNVRSISPDWIERLVQPVLRDGADYVAPLYRRHRYEGSLTNCLIAPLTRALYGKRVACHSGGGCAFSAKFASLLSASDLWEGRTARFGIDSWLTTVAAAEGTRLTEASLGTKVQELKKSGIDVATVLAQAVGASYHCMERYQDVWEQQRNSQPVPLVGERFELEIETTAIPVERMIKGFRQGIRDLLPIWEMILSPEAFSSVLTLNLADDQGFRFPVPLWVQTVYDFALAYHEKVLHREHLLKSLTPLYLGRTASLILETREGGADEVGRTMEQISETFERMKPYLIERWRFQ
ncbi:hypothetical protein [Petrachloros mirabilis]